MSDRVIRRDLGADKFTVAIENNVSFVARHRTQFIRYGIVALVVILLGAGIYFYRNSQQSIREEKLADAIQIQETNVTPGAVPGPLSFPTDEAKRDAATKAFSEVASQYNGTREGWIAEYYLGCIATDAGKLDEARKRFQSVVDSANKDYASLANLSLADLDFVQNRTSEGEKRLRDLIANPTIMVSKEQATMALAHHYATTNPAEARKLLEPLSSQTGGVSQAAVQALGELQSR